MQDLVAPGDPLALLNLRRLACWSPARHGPRVRLREACPLNRALAAGAGAAI
jgi:hypothetical protein